MSGAQPDGLAQFVVYTPSPEQERRFAHAIVRRFGEDDPAAALELLQMMGLVDEHRERTW